MMMMMMMMMIRTKFGYKIGCSLRRQLRLKKLTLIITYFEHLTIRLYILFALNTHQILCQLDIIYYLIYKLIFYA